MTALASLTGIVVSAVVAAILTVYFEIWTTSGDAPGTRGLSAQSETWWDVERDARVVRATSTEADRTAWSFRQADAWGDMDAMVAGGGLHAGGLRVRVTLMNFSKAPAVITSVRAKVLRERAIPAGPVFRCGGPQGGVAVSRIRMNLGSADRAAVEYDEEKVLGQYPTQQIQLSKQDEPAIFDIEIRAGRVAYDFAIEVRYTQGRHKETMLVDDSGKPFTLAPDVDERAPAYRCSVNEGVWTRS
ncbi:hypothetical protein IHE55_29495 [Streptomyces pactum]|uniref:Secreted protein n=1 Tax=Streptomyces pactum TaxID=68249 RepID=A0ABS0NU15_9ACTN|nr:hypothetical protein [Streptomyces pactum]MBH5338691.1 hypothetical protein [Streptomyces pactum]